jgi:ornithine cyclodeaminase/alanine dehydrogenase-like protein (mu-crystallin family)
MNRRDFLQAGALGGLILPASGAYAAYQAEKKPRVGLIGTGWYGKSDLFRLIQVAPVEVVSLCDVDKNMLADCASQVASRQESKKTSRTYFYCLCGLENA